MSYRRKRHHNKGQLNRQQDISFEVEYTNPGVSRPLSTGSLNSGQPYQRPVDEQDVDRLIRNWDGRLLTPLTISFRDGKFNVVDGQHRIEAMRKMAGGGEVIVPCLIYDGMTYEDEAALCYSLDKAKRQLNLSQATKALLESGMDAGMLDIKRLVEQNGFEWILGKRFNEVYEITATRALVSAYRLLGGAAFSRMLGLIAGTWHGAPASLKASMLSGMTLFLKTYETELNDHSFIKKLSTVAPDEIIRRSKSDFSTNRIALRVARVILDIYNNQQRESRKLSYRFKDWD